MTIKDLRVSLQLPASANSVTVINYAIRQKAGGTKILQALERLHKMQHGRPRPDPALQDLLDLMRQARDAMGRAILEGRL